MQSSQARGMRCLIIGWVFALNLGWPSCCFTTITDTKLSYPQSDDWMELNGLTFYVPVPLQTSRLLIRS